MHAIPGSFEVDNFAVHSFITSGVVGTFTPPGHPNRNFDFGLDAETQSVTEDWMVMADNNWQ
jgi:hypothetical protein